MYTPGSKSGLIQHTDMFLVPITCQALSKAHSEVKKDL